ncbi:MAG: hypothetical protein RQ751_13605 [Longimicrobiales bacterium]|nr:hypothetical protein [Longimicrobiales bacterium]
MREFEDENGEVWTATVGHREGQDYKGAWFLVLTPSSGGGPVVLEDVRWNSERTARRTLETMSRVELRRRLRSARGRAAAV